MRLQDQRRILETDGRRYWRIDYKWNIDFVIIVLGSIFGFAALIAVMVYITSESPH
jgi:hypothetical protein